MPNLRFQVSLEPQSFHRVCQGQRAKLQHKRQDSRVRGGAFLHILNLRQGTCLSSLKKHLEATWLRLEKGTQEETRFLPLREHRLPLGGIRRNRTRLKAPCRAAEQTSPATSVPLPRAEATSPRLPANCTAEGTLCLDLPVGLAGQLLKQPSWEQHLRCPCGLSSQPRNAEEGGRRKDRQGEKEAQGREGKKQRRAEQ